MKSNFLLLLLFFISINNLRSESSTKLTGIQISSNEFYDYNTNACTFSTLIRNNAFDGNLTTIFATCATTGGWVGLDLGEPYIVTNLSYCPRSGQASRMILGVFEGANKPDFGDAIPLYLIPTAPNQNVLTSQTINCSKGFRYIRYIGPESAKCNVSEIEFYGYKGIGDNTIIPKTTNLASVIIHTTAAQDIVDKETYLKGIVSVINEPGTSIYTDSLEIKGRGNVSWSFPKKPYRMKLFNKVSLLGLPAKEKNWTLINNYGDKTLMRNLLAFNISKNLDIPYTPAGVPVDVFLNGVYKGTYQLCDQIEVATERVMVEKMKITDIVAPEITGGYLLEMDAYASDELVWFESIQNKIPVTIKYPKDDEIVESQKAFIKSHFETMENAVYAANYTDNINGFRKYIDLETFLRHFLVGEISGNTDTYWSTYMYKKRDNPKFYFGPVWDFDIAFENDYRTYPINNLTDWVYATKGSSANGVKSMINRIFSDPQVVVQLRSLYATYRNNGKLSEASLLQAVDEYAARINQSQKLNFTKWNILNSKVHMNPQILGSYAAEVNSLKTFISNRFKWIDNKLNYIPSDINLNAVPNIFCSSQNGILQVFGVNQTMNIQIVDLTGRIQYSRNVSEGTTFKLQNGIYILRVYSDNLSVLTTKCMVQ
ncbi:MAG: CotH kinase family protein [Paludibacter sp.]